MTVENGMHDTILTAMDNVVVPRVAMAVELITGSTGHETNSEVQNPDRKDFLGIIRNTPLLSASNRYNLDIEMNRNDETCNDVSAMRTATFRHQNITMTGEGMPVTCVQERIMLIPPTPPSEPTALNPSNEPTSPPIVHMKQVSPPNQPH